MGLQRRGNELLPISKWEEFQENLTDIYEQSDLNKQFLITF